MSAIWHPRRDDQDEPVWLLNPSVPTESRTWTDEAALARVVPDGPMPAVINDIPVVPWRQVPQDRAAWEALAATMPFKEPLFDVPTGFKGAAGVVVRERDGRVWVVAPSNAYGGYRATFPKGGLDGKSTKAAALIEAFEETGLQVRLSGFLIDVQRSSSYTRYFWGHRVGGTPAAMGWESQAVMLVPQVQLTQVANSPRDQPIIAAMQNR